jgi:hypothetical protein
MDQSRFKSLRRILLATACFVIVAVSLVFFHRAAQVICTVFAGLLLATPFTAVFVVLVQTLCVQDVLGEKIRRLGESKQK